MSAIDKQLSQQFPYLCFQLDSECPNYGAIIPCILEHGVEELPNRCKLTPGTSPNITQCSKMKCSQSLHWLEDFLSLVEKTRSL